MVHRWDKFWLNFKILLWFYKIVTIINGEIPLDYETCNLNKQVFNFWAGLSINWLLSKTKQSNVKVIKYFPKLSKRLSFQIFQLETAVRKCFSKYVFLTISQYSLENTCARISFLIKLQADLWWLLLIVIRVASVSRLYRFAEVTVAGMWLFQQQQFSFIHMTSYLRRNSIQNLKTLTKKFLD